MAVIDEQRIDVVAAVKSEETPGWSTSSREIGPFLLADIEQALADYAKNDDGKDQTSDLVSIIVKIKQGSTALKDFVLQLEVLPTQGEDRGDVLLAEFKQAVANFATKYGGEAGFVNILLTDQIPTDPMGGPKIISQN